MGRQWWTTNLASDRYSALPDPWTTAELKWSSAENQWVENRHLLSLSKATFDYDSELPNVFNYTNEEGYIYQISQVCGTKGLIFANNSELTKFIFLPLADHEDYEFYVNIVGTPLTRKLNWHYWTKDYYEKVLYHTGASDYQYHPNDLKWSFFMTATIHIHEPNGYPYYYRPNNPEEYNGVPDYGYRFTDNEVPLYFPARPVVKQSN